MYRLLNIRFFVKKYKFIIPVIVSICVGVILINPDAQSRPSKPRVKIPSSPVIQDGFIKIDSSLRTTSIISFLQEGLDKYIKAATMPIAGALMVDVKTGRILAFSQGKSPKQWQTDKNVVHTLLHSRFPAASLFKTVVASSVLDIFHLSPDKLLGLPHGCGNVQATGSWLVDDVTTMRRAISLRKAYGNSCNAFFAKLAVNTVGVKAITEYAQRFGWNQTIPSDIEVPVSNFIPPTTTGSSVQSVGKYAAGFGMVNISAMHAAWQMLAIANNGIAMPITLFDTSRFDKSKRTDESNRIIPTRVAAELKDIMKSTVNGGTASFAFRRRPYRALKPEVGGKTGTLSSKTPEGISTWFAGMYPLSNPEVVVVTVVVLEDLWHIKAANLAAQAFNLWNEYKQKQESMTATLERPQGSISN